MTSAFQMAVRAQHSTPDQIARSRALQAVEAPDSLRAPTDAPAHLQKAYGAAQRLYAEIVVSGTEGVELRAFSAMVGKTQLGEAVKILRGSGAVAESVEPRPDSDRPLIVFRAVEE
ncbi:hypothetical protein FB468_0737 [Leucobacter komagatae]|uniref:Uncharacterized protein n=1 Tax=Leucobacter komagatae TaxID=55969 RepID=A0A542Y3T1_9MICO|nr:hypothetical protein [Leucobacter komagatae]TQL42732.1 hypothetical protein FB468_0737 [Leucobacter komagatae]